MGSILSLSSLAQTIWTFLQFVLFLGAGYILPALSSTKAVIHKDADAYYRWVAFWIIMFLFSILDPLLTVALHPMIKLLCLLWLSLPKYQGAMIIYTVTIRPLFQKYESYLQQKFDYTKFHTKRIMTTILTGTGWSMFLHMMMAVQLLGNTVDGKQADDWQGKTHKQVQITEATDNSPQD